MQMQKSGMGKTYKTGSILGVRQFQFGMSWEENVYGRYNGIILKIEKEYFKDLGYTFAKYGTSFLEFLITVCSYTLSVVRLSVVRLSVLQ